MSDPYEGLPRPERDYNAFLAQGSFMLQRSRETRDLRGGSAPRPAHHRVPGDTSTGPAEGSRQGLTGGDDAGGCLMATSGSGTTEPTGSHVPTEVRRGR